MISKRNNLEKQKELLNLDINNFNLDALPLSEKSMRSYKKMRLKNNMQESIYSKNIKAGN